MPTVFLLQELAVTHCLNTETQLVSSGPGDPRQQGLNLSFVAIDMFAKLVLLLVKVSDTFLEVMCLCFFMEILVLS
jgi:hypothetical protein